MAFDEAAVTVFVSVEYHFVTSTFERENHASDIADYFVSGVVGRIAPLLDVDGERQVK